MKISVRKATLSERDLLMEWRMRVLAEVFFDYENVDWQTIRKNNEDYYNEHLTDGTHTACFAVDTEDGRIVGCGGICYQKEMPSPDNLTGTNAYLMNIYTVPELRGEGIGRQILDFLIADAKQKGTEKIYLESSDVAKGLYQELGFTDMKDYMKL